MQKKSAGLLWISSKKNLSFKDTKKEIEERMKADIQRYKRNYGINIADFSNYDIVINTSEMTEEQMNNVILKAVKRLIN